MKFDMHCHTKEGSPDGSIRVEDTIRLLQEKGFDGMLISDHNSYRAYRHWKKNIKDQKYKDFVVLKGIEYDTLDAGHILVIMPTGVKVPLIEIRGLPVSILIEIVHYFGGILGPAHPCGERFLSFTNTRTGKKRPSICQQFDFFETFNACESPQSNAKASALADRYGKPHFGGSDSHREDCVGLGYTEIASAITCETDLIDAVRHKEGISAGGTCYTKTTKQKIGFFNHFLVLGFFFYNKFCAGFRVHKRHLALQQHNYITLKNDHKEKHA